MDRPACEDCIFALNSEPVFSNVNECAQNIQHLKSYFIQDLSDVDASILIPLIFNTKNGILRYIKKTADQNEHEKVTKEAIVLLEYLVVNLTKYVLPLSEDFAQWCLSLVSSSHSSNLKAQTLKVLNKLLESPLAEVKDNFVGTIQKLLSEKPSRSIYLELMKLFMSQAEYRSEAIKDVSWFKNYIEATYATASNNTTQSVSIIQGCLIGFNSVFFLTEPEMPKNAYSIVKKHSEFGSSGAKEALSILANHGRYFKQYLYDDHNWWLSTFDNWIGERNSTEFLATVVKALESFYKQVSVILQKKTEQSTIVFKTFIEHFSKTLGTSSHLRKSCAFYGLSYFYEHFDNYETDKSFLNFVLNVPFDNLIICPAYACCLSSFSEILGEEALLLLKKILVLLIENFANADPWFQQDILKATSRSVVALRPDSLSVHMHQVFYQGLIRCSAHPLLVDIQLLDQKVPSYLDYVPIWVELLTVGQGKSIKLREIASLVCHEFVKAFLKIINRLDLTLKEKNPIPINFRFAFEAEHPRDFQIFVNLIDLYSELLPQIDFALFRPILSDLLLNIITLSTKHPLVSGFYKALSATLETANSCELLGDLKPTEQTLLREYLKKVVLLIDVFSEELQLACLKLILRAPDSFVEKTINVFLAALRLGSGCLDILQDCVEALEKYASAPPSEQSEFLLKQVLPELDVFLQSDPSTDDHFIKVDHIVLKSRGKVKRRLAASSDCQLVTVQRKILYFLGRLDPELTKQIVKPPPFWLFQSKDSKSLPYRLPLPDFKPNLKFVKIIPRVLELALGTGERQTRIAACEFIHNILLVAIENTKHSTSDPQLFRKLFESALILSVDADRIVRDLFQNLLIQTTHYFSGFGKEKSEAAEVIEVLMEGVSHQFNPAIRDFSASCLNELIVWSAKQYNKVTIRAVIRSILTYALHPERCKRYGSAIALNAIYKTLREDKTILEIYWFKIFWHMSKNLEMYNESWNFEKTSISLALKTLIRPLCELEFFNNENPDRRIAPGIEGSTLKDLASYIFFKLCRSKSKCLRDVARYCLTNIVKNIKGCGSLKAFLADHPIVFETNSLEERIVSLETVIWLLEEEALTLEEIDWNVIRSLRNLAFEKDPKIIDLMKFYTLIGSLNSFEVVEKFGSLLLDTTIAEGEEEYFCKILKQYLVQHDFYINVFDLPKKLVNAESSALLLIIRTKQDVKPETIKGCDILTAVFESLYEKNGSKEVTIPIEPSRKKYLKKVVKFTLDNQSDEDRIFSLICHQGKVWNENPFWTLVSRGAYFLSEFEDIIFEWLALHPQLTASKMLSSVDQSELGQFKKLLHFIKDNRGNSSFCIKEAVCCQFQNNILVQIELNLEKYLSIKALIEILLITYEIFPENIGLLKNFKKTYLRIINLFDEAQEECEIRFVFQMLPFLSTPGETRDDHKLLNEHLLRYQKKCLTGPKPACNSADYALNMSIFNWVIDGFKKTGSLILLEFILTNLPEYENNNFISSKFNFRIDVTKGVLDFLHNFVFSENLDLKTTNYAADLLVSMVKQTEDREYFKKYLTILASLLSDSFSGSTLPRKTCAIKLMQIFFLITSAEERKSLNKPAEIKIVFMEACKYIKINDQDKKIQEALRKYRCACVNFLCTAVTNYNDETAYIKFLFDENLLKKVVPAENYNLGMEFNAYPKRKSVLTAIKSNRKQELPSSWAFAASSTLFESTLNEDVRKFDLTNAVITKEPIELQLELEMDTLNELECMPSLCGVVQHMVDEKIPPLQDIPCWLKYCINIFDSDFSCNETLVALKLIHNMRKEACKYSEKITGSILKAVSLLLSTTGSVNYLIIDILLMIVEKGWIDSTEAYATPSKLKILDSLVTVNGANFSDLKVVKFVMDVVEILIGLWKGVIIHSDIYEILDKRIVNFENWPDNTYGYVTVELANIIMANDISIGGNHKKLLKWLSGIIEKKTKIKAVTNKAAQVFGMILKSSPENAVDFCSGIYLTTEVLYNVHTFYPNIVKQDIDRLIRVVFDETPQELQYALQMILKLVESDEESKEERKTIKLYSRSFFTNLFASNVVSIQELSLEILLKVHASLDLSDFKYLIAALIKLSKHPVKSLKKLSSQILLEVYKKYPELSKECKVALLKRYDTEEVFKNFLSTFSMDGRSSQEKVVCIFENLFQPEVSHEFLKYATKTILDLTKGSPEYSLPLYENPLHECEYQELKILDSWRAQRTTMPPLFAPSVAGELPSVETDSSTLPLNSPLLQELKATAQTLLFSPTLDGSPATLASSNINQQHDEQIFRKPDVPTRFVKHSDKRKFISIAVNKMKKEEKVVADRTLERGKRVSLSRKYRSGDYPDVQILHKSFLAPLQTLLLKDQQTARNIFVLLIKSILSETALNGLTAVLSKMLREASDMSLIGAIMDLAFGKIDLDSGLLLAKAKSSGLYSLGAILIEEQLKPAESAEKRMKQNNDSWLDLAQVYQKIGDFEALQGIFLNKLSLSEEEQEAILAESIADWEIAARYYEQVHKIQSITDDRLRFYNQAYLGCLAHLGNWEELDTSARALVSSDEHAMWKDVWCSEALLPWHLSAAVKLLLPDSKEAFCDFFAKILNDPMKEETLKGKYSYYLLLKAVIENDERMSTQYLELTLQRFLLDWKQINGWEDQIRLRKLEELQLTAEIQALRTKEEIKHEPKRTHNLINWDLRLTIREVNYNPELYEPWLAFTDAAAQQNNFVLMKQVINKIATRFGHNEDVMCNSFYIHCKNNFELLKAKNYMDNKDIRLEKYMETWTIIEKSKAAITSPEFLIKTNRSILKVISTIMDLQKVDVVDGKSISLCPYSNQRIEDCWKSCFEETLKLFNNLNESFEDEKGIVYLDYYKFLAKQGGCGKEKLETILKAMACGNVEARHLFGKALLDNSDVSCEAVPAWMFLMWRHQLITKINTKIVRDIVLRIAQEYPSALKIELRLVENLLAKSEHSDYVALLRKIVFTNNVESQFYEQLCTVASPKYMLRHVLTKLKTSVSNFKWTLAQNLLKTAIDLCGNDNDAYSEIRSYKSELEKLTDTLENSVQIIQNILKKLTPMRGETRVKRLLLGSHSKWLEKFHWLKHNARIEIPGQYDLYTGKSSPRLKNHVLISSLKPDILVLPSKCEPIKVVFIGSNAKLYSFLIKYGEDLRQDARIQQLCQHINIKYRNNHLHQKLIVKTYNVIPLTVSCGLVQWLENTESFRSLIGGGLREYDLEMKKHINYLGEGLNFVAAHINGYMTKSLDEAVGQYNLRCKAFPIDSLRKTFLNLTQSLEHFVAFRSNFSSSLAAMYVAHWLLAVGDRHLGNLLLSVNDGTVVGIDFGLAFGAAVELLPLPELPPLRLTPQIMEILRPMNESGWIRQGMIKCLTALRSDPGSFTAMLDVFVTDPCVSWTEAAEKLAKEQDEESIADVQCWSVKRKVNAVMAKLEGANPIRVIEEDLRCGHERKNFFEKCLEILRGSQRPLCLRKTFRLDEKLSPEQQVDCLIDLATDPPILAFTYVGWESWL